MSTSQPTLFGAYPWAVSSTVSPVLYATGYVPQTYSVPLDETLTGSEADLFNTTKPLADSVALTEAQIKTLMKVLADSETLSDAAVTKTIHKIFSETGSLTDNGAVIFTIKDLADFLVIKEWLSIRLEKQIVWVGPSPDSATWTVPAAPPVPTWVNPSANANIFDTLWGKYTYGGRNVLFGGLKPLASWSKGPVNQQPSVWTNEDGHKYNS